MFKCLIAISSFLTVFFSVGAFASTSPHCEYRPPIDGDSTVSYAVNGEPSEKTYSYLVKRDVFGDGTDIVLYPIYSKNWLLTDGQLREIVGKDRVHVIGGETPEKISTVRTPKDENDFKTFKEIYFDPKAKKICNG